MGAAEDHIYQEHYFNQKHVPDPVTLAAVIDESVLHRPVGGRDVLLGQIAVMLAHGLGRRMRCHERPAKNQFSERRFLNRIET